VYLAAGWADWHAHVQRAMELSTESTGPAFQALGRLAALLLGTHWECILKYLEIFIAITCWVISALWFNNAPLGEFPYEPSLAFLGGLLAFCDSVRRFGFFSRVNILVRNPSITPWSFTGGKINKSNVSTEIFIENNKITDVLIQSIELNAPVRINDSIGESNRRFRFVDLANIGFDIRLPVIIPS